MSSITCKPAYRQRRIRRQRFPNPFITRLLSVLALILLLAPSGAFAQGEPPDDQEKAIQLFQKSGVAYKAGKFQEAADLLLEAYRLDPNPTLLYNLARALESAGDPEGALDAYRRYLSEAEEIPDRVAIEARVANLDRQVQEKRELRARLKAEQAAKEAAARAAEEAQSLAAKPKPRVEGPGAVPWIIAGVGALGLGGGAVLGLMAQSEHQNAQDAANQQETVKFNDSAQGLATGANIAFIAGGVVAAGGLIWGLVAPSGDDEDPEAVTATFSFSPHGFAITGTF